MNQRYQPNWDVCIYGFFSVKDVRNADTRYYLAESVAAAAADYGDAATTAALLLLRRLPHIFVSISWFFYA